MNRNPVSLIKIIKTQFPDNAVSDLEYDTIIHIAENDVEKEILSAILFLVKQYKKLLEDPIYFSQFALGINGISPDFSEIEVLTQDIIFSSIYLYPILLKEVDVSAPDLSEDVKMYLSVCLVEDGYYYLNGYMKSLQKTLEEVLKNVYNTEIPVEDMLKCDALWLKYKDTKNVETIPETDHCSLQVKANLTFMAYSKEKANA